MTEEALRGIQWTAGLDALRRRELRRIVAVSAAAHLLLVVAYSWAPRSPGVVALPGVVTVELVAAPAPARPAAPRPKPPVAKKVVLPTEPSEVKVKPKPKAPPEPKAPDKSYEDILRDLKAKSGEAAEERPAEPVRTARAAAGVAGGNVRGVRVSPEVAAWLRTARIHVRRSWVLAPGFRTQPLETHVSVRLDAQGNLVGDPKITVRSGNPWYDDSVLRALAKADPLPAPPEAGEWPFVFRPEDLL